MAAFDLQRLPDWPALMNGQTAEQYLGGSPSVLRTLQQRGWLRPLKQARNGTLFRRADLDAALAIAAARGEGLETDTKTEGTAGASPKSSNADQKS